MAETICPQCKAANKDTGRFCSECGASLLGVSSQAPNSHKNQPSLSTGLLLQERYRIVKELGRGGFGAVYRAWDTRLNKAVAVKENLETSPEAQRQFAREALILANLSHPNLPRVTDHFSLVDQGQYLVMDFVEGQDLETRVREKDIVPVEQALAWILQVAEALEYLHGQNPPVFHRDIKPANVRITPQGKAMLVDFGLVKASSPNMKTTMGARAISPGYAPPEQYGHGRTDARTDIYALAATLYRLVSGHEPPESVQRIAGDALLSTEKLNPQVPIQLSQAIERGMALEPEKRFPTASDFKSTLQQGMAASRTVGSDKPIVGKAPSYQTQPAIEPPAQPISKPPFWKKDLHTKVVNAETGQSLRTQIVDEPASTPGQISGTGVGMQSTVRMSESLPEPGAIPAPTTGKPLPRWLIFASLGSVVVILMIVAIIAAMAIGGGGSSNKTATAEIKNTMLARVQGTQTRMAQDVVANRTSATTKSQATVALQGTAEKRSTLTERAVSSAIVKTSTAQVRIQATNQAMASILAPLGINATPKLIYGPVSGNLIHDPGDGYIESDGPDDEIKNFLVQVEFFTPFSSIQGDWDYGIGFRDIGTNNDYRIILFSDKTFSFERGIDTIFEGKAQGMKVGEGESNLIQLVAMDAQGWLFVNGTQVATLNLSALPDPGYVWVGTGMYTDDEIAGESTRYSDFTIWELP